MRQVTWEDWWEDSPRTIIKPEKPAVAIHFYQERRFEIVTYACYNLPPSVEWDEIIALVQDMLPENIFWNGDRRYNYWGWAAYTFSPIIETEKKITHSVHLHKESTVNPEIYREIRSLNDNLEKLGVFKYNKLNTIDTLTFSFKRVFKGKFLGWDGFVPYWNTIRLFSLGDEGEVKILDIEDDRVLLHSARKITVLADETQQVIYTSSELSESYSLWKFLQKYDQWDKINAVPGMSNLERNLLIKRIHREEGLSRRDARKEGFHRWEIANGRIKPEGYWKAYEQYQKDLRAKYKDEWELVKAEFIRKKVEEGAIII